MACTPPVTPEARAEAKQLFEERCVRCHGPRGKGDGPGAFAVMKPPRDLTNPMWQKKVDDQHIATVIVDGGRAVGLSDDMPANADLRAKPAVVAALVEYVRNLR